MKIVIIGGTGFIGSHLASYLKERGHELLLLSRHPKTADVQEWRPTDSRPLEGAEVVINLAGESIFGRWNEKKKRAIRQSRVVVTEELCHLLLNLKTAPQLYIGASAMGYYGDRDGEVLTEASEPGKDFFSELCKEWEQAAAPLETKNIRVVLARFSIVLGQDGGALRYLEKGFRMGMGGYLGSGKQVMSWIAIEDLCAAMQHLIDHPELHGPVNFAAPQAVTNQEFAQTLGKLLHRPALLPVPKMALSMLFGEGAEMFLASTHLSSARLLETGFQFHFPQLEGALKKYLST